MREQTLAPKLGLVGLCAWAAVAAWAAAAGPARKVLRAGAATSNITPWLGEPVVGGWRALPATHVHDELHARCLVLDDGTTRLAIVVADNLGIPREVLDEAKRQYDKVLKEEPDNPDARNNLAIALYRTGRRAEAKEQLLALVHRFPRHADAFNNLAVIAIDDSDWVTAEQMARRAVETDPLMASAWNNLGIALDEQSRLGDAEDAFARSLDIDPVSKSGVSPRGSSGQSKAT